MRGAAWEAGSRRLAPFLSERGRAARMPEGIRVWGERAARAGGVDATLGVVTAPPTLLGAADGPETIAYLPEIREAFAAWAPREVFPYAPVAGTREFRDRWRAWIAGKSAGGAFGDPAAGLGGRLTRPVATSGVTGGLCAVAQLTLDPGESVVVPDRRWDGYDTSFGVVGGVRLVPTRLLDGGAWDLAAWERALVEQAGRQARVVCVANFPHNPTGYVPTEAEAEAFAALLAEVAERTGRPVVAVCDDAYEGYVYADRPRWSLFYRLVDRHPGVLPVKCDGITKELLFWGGRLGAVTTAFHVDWADDRTAAEAVWEDKLSAVVRGMYSSASTPVQTLVARAMADPAAVVAAREPVLALLAGRWAATAAALERPAAREAFDPDPFHGGLFALLSLRRGDAVGVAERLLERRIGVVPFRAPEIGLNALRLTYATVPAERLDEVVAAAAAEALG